MASKTSALALFLIFNLLFFTFASACSSCPPKRPKLSPTQPSQTPPTPVPTPPNPSTSPSPCAGPTPSPTTPSPTPSTPTPPTPTPSTPTARTPTPPTPMTPSPTSPTPSPSSSSGSSSSSGKCPIDALKLGVCANVLGGLLNVTIGTPPKEPCCSLLSGLVDLEVAACLCTAIKANILGINLNLPINLSLLVNYCGNEVPPGFQCA